MNKFHYIFRTITLMFALGLYACGGSGSSNESTAVITPVASIALEIEISGEGLGQVTIVELNKTCSESCTVDVEAHSTVTLKATPLNDDYKFNGWQGCQQQAECKVTVSAPKKVAADFSSTDPVVVIINTFGSGKISFPGLDLSCGNKCEFEVERNSNIVAIAEPNTGEEFIEWLENCKSTTATTCYLDAIADLHISAAFSGTDLVTISINVTGQGQVSIAQLDAICESTCEYNVEKGTELTLIALENDGQTFEQWGDICTIVGQECTISATENITISAAFSHADGSLPLTIKVIGSGTIELADLNESCLNNCTFQIQPGTNVKLNAVPNTGINFLNWDSICEQQSNECEFVVENGLTVTAFFENEPIEPTSNTITIKEPNIKARSQLPIQIARPFVKGEIKGVPRVRIDGQNVSSQSVVKQRYDDGSVKHAIINFVLESLPQNGEVTANIVNEESVTFTPFNKSQLLANSVNFDATFEYDFNGTTTSISARDMLENDQYTIWSDGSVATTLLIQDHSIQRTADIGSDEHRSVRSLFYVTYWKSIDQYSVRFVSENINTTTLQDQQYSVKLYLTTEQNLAYENTAINHQARTRWTKTFGTYDDSPTSINHNVSYLVQTPSVPNFDTSKHISDDKTSLYWTEWQSRDSDIYQKGFWQPAMATAGGRPDIGLYPSWTVKWLYTGDWRLANIAFTQADLSGNWPMHYREGDSDRTFDFEQEVPGLGRIVSMAPGARPTHWTYRPTWHEIDDEDKIPYIGDVASTIWRPDTAHHPDVSSLQYLLSGDYFYLEQMLFSAAFVSGDSNAKAYKRSYGRGPTGSEGAMYSGEVRAQAWHLRTRVHAYDIMPDDFHEKTYFGQLISNAIALWEGKYRVPNSQPALKDLYDFSVDNISTSFVGNGQPSELGYWDSGITSASYVSNAYVNTDNVSRATAPWMQNMVVGAMGRAAELGWPTENLLEYSSRSIRGIFSHDIEPNLLFAYVLPTHDSETKWFTDWPSVFGNYQQSYKDQLVINVANGQDTEHGYYSIAMTAAAYSKDLDNGLSLWQFIQANIANKESYHSNPKWALTPR